MKRVVNMSSDERRFVLRLLHITRHDFERAFVELSKSESVKGMRKFAAYWCELAELAFTETEDDEQEENTEREGKEEEL